MTILAKLSGVTKTFANGVKALGPVDLDIRAGEFLSLVGPSGCGKSTALRVIAGLIAPSAGKVEWPGARPRIGFVFQDPTLMPWATARENVRLPLELAHLSHDERSKRADAALARVGLAGFEDAYPRALSGGMRMRVSIARALAAGPELLLMDEPFAALDELTREQLNEDLLKLWREDRMTVVFVTHSVYESAFLSQRVAVMTPRPGRIATTLDFAPPETRNHAWRLTSGFGQQAAAVSRALRSAMGEAA